MAPYGGTVTFLGIGRHYCLPVWATFLLYSSVILLKWNAKPIGMFRYTEFSGLRPYQAPQKNITGKYNKGILISNETTKEI